MKYIIRGQMEIQKESQSSSQRKQERILPESTRQNRIRAAMRMLWRREKEKWKQALCRRSNRWMQTFPRTMSSPSELQPGGIQWSPAVLTFLTTHDFTGKTVIPFMTNGGWPGHVIKDVKANCKGADFAHEMQIRFDSMGKDHLETPESEIEEWVEKVKQELR